MRTALTIPNRLYCPIVVVLTSPLRSIRREGVGFPTWEPLTSRYLTWGITGRPCCERPEPTTPDAQVLQKSICRRKLEIKAHQVQNKNYHLTTGSNHGASAAKFNDGFAVFALGKKCDTFVRHHLLLLRSRATEIPNNKKEHARRGIPHLWVAIE